MGDIYEYLIIMTDSRSIVGYYLLTDAAMAKADENEDDYWAFLMRRRRGVRMFASMARLIEFMAARQVKLTGEFSDVTY